MSLLSRRRFLQTSAAAAGALSARSWVRAAGANGDIRVAVIGMHGRGKSHLSALSAIPGVRIVALCDVDTAVMSKASASLKGVHAGARGFVDLRKLFDDPGVDAVTIATPNHWHSLAGIWALQAGKDVYVEKPVSHNVWEGRQLANAGKKYPRIIQAGTQCRSSTGLIEAQSWIASGGLGKIKVSRGLCYKRRASIGRTFGPGHIPSTVDYDLWVGPAPMEPPHRRQFHYDWHWFWATGNGDLGNQGIHQMDLARWFLGEPRIAPHTLSVGGRLGYVDDGETPNTDVIVHDYPSAPLVFEVRGLPAHREASSAGSSGGENGPTQDKGDMDRYPSGPKGASIGLVVECEGGNLVIPTYSTAFAYDRQGKRIRTFGRSDEDSFGSHMTNFIEAVRSRRSQDLRGPIEGGHISSALCHTGNISYRLGGTMLPDEIREHVRGNAAAAEAFGRMVEHLQNNGVDLRKTPATLGVPLVLDPERETIKDNPAADPYLTRDYRAPYVVSAIG